MSSRIGFWIAVLLLLLAAALRLWHITTLPSGFHEDEITNVRIIETVREGNVEVFYSLGDEGREGLYHIGVTFVTALVGKGILGYRITSVWANMLALAVLYTVGRRIVGVTAGLCAMALMTVSFWPILLSRQVTPVTLLPLLVASILLALTIALPIYRQRGNQGENIGSATTLGLLLGLGLYIHPAGLMTLVFGLAFILYTMRAAPHPHHKFDYISFALLLMIIIGMPYLISSIRWPDLNGVQRLMGDAPHLSPIAAIKAIGGIFIQGDPNPLSNLPKRPLVDIVSGVFICAGIIIAMTQRRASHMLLLIALGILSPIFLLSAHAPDFVNYASALPLLALLFGLGIQSGLNAIPHYRKHWAGVGLLALLAVNILWTHDSLFEKWPQNSEVESALYSRHGQLANYIDRTAEKIETVICGWTPTQSHGGATLTDAQIVELMMHRKNAPVRYADCYSAMVIIQGGSGQQIIVPDTQIFETAHPEIRAWLGRSQLREGKNTPADGILWLDVEQHLADAMGRLTAQTTVSYAPETGGSLDERVNPPITFGDNLTLLGYILNEEIVYKPGDTVSIVTYWRVDGVIPRDLCLFTHILADPGASPPANTDIINVNPRRLQNRDVFAQVTYVPLPDALPPGEYYISIGAYHSETGERLVVLENGVERGTRLFLYTITVAETE